MKTLRISDETHRKLTATLGTLMAQTGKMQTYQDAIEVVLNQSVILPTELLEEIENFVETSKHLGFMTREEFLCDAVRWRLKFLKKNYEYVEIQKEKYEKLNKAVKEMNTQYHNALDFIHIHIDNALEKYDEWLKEKRHKR
ncbi:MAG: hypothetical protein QXQ94_08465 [Candidatus Bathyarchaeia archaeon]